MMKPLGCSIQGCGAAHHAHGMCKRHYSTRRRAEKGDALNAQRRTPPTVRTCPVCATSFSAANRKRYCSPRCKKRHDNAEHGRSPQEAAAYRRMRKRLLGANYDKHRKRARRYGVEYRPVSNRYIFERDGYRCQLCDRRLNKRTQVPHPNAPTLDHIIPISQGGPHTETNLQCACFHCNLTNLTKHTNAANDQLLLVG